MTQEHGEKPAHQSEDSPEKFYAVLAGTVLFGLVAFGLSFLLGTPFGPQFQFSMDDVFIGIIATLPPVVFLWWFSNTDMATFAEFRHSQIEFFADIGFKFTRPRILAMAVGAGICEELLFRGVFQPWLASFSPVIFAIIVSNIVFGFLHMRTLLYALIAGGVGVYFGALYALNGNLIAPMIAHGLYDAVALEYTRRAVIAFNATRASA